MTNIIEQGRAAVAGRLGFRYKKNVYTCEGVRTHGPGQGGVRRCQGLMITIDRDTGVTPFMSRCPSCQGLMKSSLYRVYQGLYPTHEWYRPDKPDEVPEGLREHVSWGGLILREITV